MAALAQFVLLLLAFPAILASDRRAANEAFIERISNGMKMAKEYFGMDSAAMKAADFVLRAFQQPAKPAGGTEQTDRQPEQQSEEPLGALRSVVKLFGLEPAQISAVAVNAIIFVAQMITTFLNGAPTRQRGRTVRSSDPSSWIVQRSSPKLQNLLTLARNESLPSLLEDYIKGDEDTSCVQLLLCKITPFVSKMQAAVFGAAGARSGEERSKGSSVLYRHLPSRAEVEEKGAVCERLHPACDLS